MEELRKVAKAYYNVASDDIKKEAQRFFTEMDNNGDHSVSLHEFLDFMRQERYKDLRSSDLFKQLCGENNENLEFMDVMTLYYIIRSGRPFCDGCARFIKDIYFCCIKCFHNSKENYCLCTECFIKQKTHTKLSARHHHQFVDNFTLLEIKRIEALKGAGGSDQATSSRIEPYDEENDKENSLALVEATTSLALVKATGAATLATKEKGRKRKVALKTFEKFLMAGGSAAQIISCAIQ